MRVVFIQYGENISYAQMMVESCKKFGYEVWQLSDMTAPIVKGVDRIDRQPMTEGRMIYRARRLAELKPPYVLLDTDMIVAKDISEGFGCDIGITWRYKHLIWVKGEEKPVRMPYNGGVIFVRSQEFMQDCLKHMESQTPKYQDWYGDQLAIRDVIESNKYKVHVIKDELWNYIPDSDKPIPEDVKIVHFKGLRKPMMKEYANA